MRACLLKSGAVSGWSFGFITKRQQRRNGANEISEVELLEGGPTLVPANPATATVGVKALDAERDDLGVMTVSELRTFSEAAIADIDTKALAPIRVRTFEIG